MAQKYFDLNSLSFLSLVTEIFEEVEHLEISLFVFKICNSYLLKLNGNSE